jgi:hypothetical protein
MVLAIPGHGYLMHKLPDLIAISFLFHPLIRVGFLVVVAYVGLVEVTNG